MFLVYMYCNVLYCCCCYPQAKEVQEELAMDMKILEQMLTASTNEAMQSLQRKVIVRCVSPFTVEIKVYCDLTNYSGRFVV